MKCWAIAAAATLIGVAGAGAFVVTERGAPAIADRAPGDRPELMLMSSLPIIFSENFTLAPGKGAGGSMILSRIAARYRVRPIALADSAGLGLGPGRGRMLLMAHPRAQTAEALVDLDAWVRGGGRLLLLADPALDWPSERGLGDPLRPPPGYADTGLLAHWGVALDRPEARGPVRAMLDGRHLLLLSPGRLEAPNCTLLADRIVARCRIGRGAVTVIADADLIDPAQAGNAIGDNLDSVVAELARLETSPARLFRASLVTRPVLLQIDCGARAPLLANRVIHRVVRLRTTSERKNKSGIVYP